MPSPTGGFFAGLAQGLFDTIGRHEKEAREEDFKKRGETLNYLTSMLDQTTPETRPILMQQISDVMKLKGKQRGVWDMITGGGRQNYSDALGQKLSEITGNIVGPREYERLKGGVQVDTSQAPGAGGPAWASLPVNVAPDQTAGKIALLDPRADRLAQIREQYGAMREAGLERLEYTEAARMARQEDAQQHAKEIAEMRQYNSAFGPVFKQAATIAASKKKPKFDDEDLAEAAGQIAQQQGLNLDLLKARIGLAGAKELEAKANAQATGLGTNDPFAGMKPGERARFDQSQQQNAAGVYGQWQKAYAEVQKIDSEQKTLRAELARLDPATGMAVSGTSPYSFDETQGTYVGQGGKVVDYVGASTKAKIAKLKQLEAQKQALRATLQSSSAALKAQYPDYYNVTDEWTVTPNAGFGGVMPTGAARTGTTYDATTKPGTNIADMQEVIGSAARPSSNYKVGQIVSIGGKKYQVTSVTPPTQDRPHGSYILKAQ